MYLAETVIQFLWVVFYASFLEAGHERKWRSGLPGNFDLSVRLIIMIMVTVIVASSG